MAFDLSAMAYDVLSDPDERIAREGAFLKRLVPAGGRALDMACGTGGHAQFLARWGTQVIANDLSPAMIEHAQAKRPHQDIQYEVRDMRQPPAGPFDLVLCLGNSLNLLPCLEEVGQVLSRVSREIPATGQLLIQCINPESPAHQEPVLTSRSRSVDGFPLVVVKSMVPMREGRLLTLTAFDQRPDQLRSTPQIHTSACRLLDLTHAQLSDLLAEAGFGDLAWYGSMKGDTFVPHGSPDLVVVCRKA